MIFDCLEKILHGSSLTTEESSAVMEEILSGEASLTQESAFLVALAMKGESEAELLGMLRSLREKAPFLHQYGPVEVAISNTDRGAFLLPRSFGEARSGGKPGDSFDVGTAAAFVVAGAGVHALQQALCSDDRSMGSDMVLEALGIDTRLSAAAIGQCVSAVGIGFVFEPVSTEAMERFRLAYRDIPVPTAFNLLLSMLNPGGAPAMVLGVHSVALQQTVAGTLARMGVRQAFVFAGGDGPKETANDGRATVAELRKSNVQVGLLDPADFGFPAVGQEDLSAGEAPNNAEAILSVLQGEQGSRRNLVLLSAAPGIVCGGKARDLAEGVRVASSAIDSGEALRRVRSLADLSRRLS